MLKHIYFFKIICMYIYSTTWEGEGTNDFFLWHTTLPKSPPVGVVVVRLVLVDCPHPVNRERDWGRDAVGVSVSYHHITKSPPPQRSSLKQWPFYFLLWFCTSTGHLEAPLGWTTQKALSHGWQLITGCRQGGQWGLLISFTHVRTFHMASASWQHPTCPVSK